MAIGEDAQKKDLLISWQTYEEKSLSLIAEMEERSRNDAGAKKALTAWVMEDLEAWFMLMVKTFDPRPGAKGMIPMIPYPFQMDLLNKIEQNYRDVKDLLVEKSRDMGATWLFVGWVTHKWIFESDFSFLWGSRKEDAVDNHTVESIFGKHDYLLHRLPRWLPGIEEYHAGRRNRLRKPILITNPTNGNTIAGESTNENFSRSGRYSAIGLDEFAFWDVDRLAWGATADSSPVRFVLSTPNGRGNQFADLRFPVANTPGRIDVQTLHWREHPRKDQAWYENERRRRTPEDLAREVEISYERSAHGRIYQFWARHKYAKKEIDYNPDIDLYISWDFGIDTTALLWIQPGPGHDYRVIGEYEAKDSDIDHFVKKIYERQDTRGYKKAYHCGDPSGNNRAQLLGGVSVIERLASYGMDVETPPRPMCHYDNRIRKAALILKFTRVSKDCVRFVECLENYRNSDRVDRNKPDKPQPILNWASHLVTAFEYFALLMPDPDLGDLEITEPQNPEQEQETADWALNRGRFSGERDGAEEWR